MGFRIRHGYSRCNLEVGRVLGRGQPGTVTYLCTDKQTQEQFACKSISKKAVPSVEAAKDVEREVAVMAALPEHPNIVTLYDAFQDERAAYLVMELCEGGELYERIDARNQLYTEREAAKVMRTIMEVVQACHGHGVMHRDLKPENFLFLDKSDGSPLKAIDFGMSAFFRAGEKFSDMMGTPRYMAPEIWKRDYGPEVDVWSAGVILHFMLSGENPFDAETDQGVAREVLHGNLALDGESWPTRSDSVKSLVRHMLEKDPTARYNAQQVLHHPWLQDA